MTVLAQAQRPALVVADDPDIAKYLQLSIDPGRTRESCPGVALCEHVRYSQFGQVPLERFAVVCLYDPSLLTAQQSARFERACPGWQWLCLSFWAPSFRKRSKFIALGILTGQACGREAYLDVGNRNCFFQPVRALAPCIFHAFGQIASEVHWNLYPVFSHWSFESPLADNAQTLINCSDGSGPVTFYRSEWDVGKSSRFTTPIPEPQQLDRPLWSEHSVDTDIWPSFFLLLGCVRTLSGAIRPA